MQQSTRVTRRHERGDRVAQREGERGGEKEGDARVKQRRATPAGRRRGGDGAATRAIRCRCGRWRGVAGARSRRRQRLRARGSQGALPRSGSSGTLAPCGRRGWREVLATATCEASSSCFIRPYTLKHAQVSSVQHTSACCGRAPSSCGRFTLRNFFCPFFLRSRGGMKGSHSSLGWPKARFERLACLALRAGFHGVGQH